MNQVDAIVVGGGVAGLTAATLLAHRGLRVRLLESGPRLGGKAGSVTVDGVEFDTGPSVLTLPHVIEAVLDEVGVPRDERFECIELSPSFRYVFPNGVSVDFHHDLAATFESVEACFGSRSRREFEGYLAHARRIWEAAAPHFVFARAPELSRVLMGGPGMWSSVRRIDAFRTLRQAIQSQVRTPELVTILERYATYNGSDARYAPATLGCIAHVELGLGGYGVRGGLRSVVRALEAAARRSGVQIELGARVEELLFRAGRLAGVGTHRGEQLAASVVLAADLWQFQSDFPRSRAPGPHRPLSMSAHNALILRDKASELAPHTVIFPRDYEQEFVDIFDRKRVPREPTVYVCAQDRCHGRTGRARYEPLFLMVNAPAVEEEARLGEATRVLDWMQGRLAAHGMIGSDDRIVWSRTPSDLSREFPGSEGALYGPASNSMSSAFRRLPNRLPAHPGLYVASGSAHPGGGVPLAVQSGRLAAQCLLEDRRASR